MPSAVLPPAATTTGRRPINAHLSDFAELKNRVLSAGLMRRTPVFYLTASAIAGLALAGIITAVLLLGDTWWQLLPAAALGVLLSQLGFLAHEASHRQIFASGRRNDWAGRIIATGLVGISHGWWMNKHTRHHSGPNQLGKDPDIENSVVAFHGAQARLRRTPVGRWLTSRQGRYFIPLLLLEGLELHVSGLRRVLSRAPMKHRPVELAMLVLRLGGGLALAFLLFPPGLALAFVAVQLAVFGLLLGGAFAPNHIGMPMVDRGVNIDFLRRQVLMSRNLSGGPLVRFLMGGLDTQIEHHLFPGMPRPQLRKAQRLVRDFCAEKGIHYTETTLVQSYRSIIGHLNRVGITGQDLFACPLAQQLRTA